MTKTEKVIPGTWHTITCTAPATVTQQIDGETATLATLTESGTTTFRPSASTITVQTDGKYHILPTKAPAAGSSGGSTNLTLADLAELKQSAAEVREAVQTLEGTANVKANNTFYGVNTFNGSFVANGTTTLPAQTTVDGIPLPDLQGMQTALSSFLAGVGELSRETQLQPVLGHHAKTWDEWTARNPTWAQQDTLIFYAPFAPTGVANMDSNSNVTTNAVKRSLWISPMLPARINTNNALTKALGKDISLYCTASGKLSGVMNIYDAKKVTVITPYATGYESFISNIGFLASSSDNAMHIYAPELQKIVYSGTNTTFYYMPILAEFSIYAPKLTTSFYFSYATNHDTDGDGYVQGQTCAVLQSLIAGIGTAPEPDPNAEPPIEQQTITTQYPQGTDDEIVALEAAAAAKNWQFVYNKTEK